MDPKSMQPGETPGFPAKFYDHIKYVLHHKKNKKHCSFWE